VSLLDAVGHDLRGSLAVILGSVGTLVEFRDALSDPQQADLLQTIKDEAIE
jgi:K+-sensing histidine kinase KdpD